MFNIAWLLVLTSADGKFDWIVYIIQQKTKKIFSLFYFSHFNLYNSNTQNKFILKWWRLKSSLHSLSISKCCWKRFKNCWLRIQTRKNIYFLPDLKAFFCNKHSVCRGVMMMILFRLKHHVTTIHQSVSLLRVILLLFMYSLLY